MFQENPYTCIALGKCHLLSHRHGENDGRSSSLGLEACWSGDWLFPGSTVPVQRDGTKKHIEWQDVCAFCRACGCWGKCLYNLRPRASGSSCLGLKVLSNRKNLYCISSIIGPLLGKNTKNHPQILPKSCIILRLPWFFPRGSMVDLLACFPKFLCQARIPVFIILATPLLLLTTHCVLFLTDRF